jgi:hypothetical protein
MLSQPCKNDRDDPKPPRKKTDTHMKIKNTLFSGMAALALLAAAGSSGMASTIVLNTNSFSDISGGGEFSATVTSPGSLGIDTSAYSTNANHETIFNGNFETFCLESNVPFTPGTTYNVSVSQTVLKTGGPLTLGAAWLYMEFAEGSLSGYNYSQSGSARKASALSLQWAIWYLQGQDEPDTSHAITSADLLSSGADTFLTDLSTAHLSSTEFNANNGTYSVAALVLTDNAGYYYQDQLVMTSPGGGGGAGVPDGGATVMLLGIAVGGMSFLKRKFV